MPKLYIVTRRDLSPGYQLAQSCHAMRQWSEEHPDLDREWFRNSNYLVCLSVENLEELLTLVDRALSIGITTTWFREPDLNDELTAAVFEPGDATRELLRPFSLALRGATENDSNTVHKRNS